MISREGYQRSYACVWFHYGWAGIARGARLATLAGAPVTAPGTLRPPFWVHDRVEDELLLSSRHITPTTLPEYVKALADFRPDLLRGFPSSIYLLALHLLETGSTSIRPRAVFTSSETLLERQRRVIEEAFRCKVFSFYSNAERASHVLQCESGNYHVVTEACVVEVLDPAGSPVAPGEAGELVCTSLVDLAMPLVRYRVGDTGVLGAGQCGCGLRGPFLSDITGRVEDMIVTPDGRHVARLDGPFKDMLRVREAQIVQDDVRAIVVRIVPRQGFGPADERLMLDELRLRLGNSLEIRVELVGRIDRTEGGKFRFVVSRVPSRIGRVGQAEGHPA